MAREQARGKCCFFPTQQAVLNRLAGVLKLPASGLVTIADPCAGTGAALVSLADQLGERNDKVKIVPFGCELDRERCEQADRDFKERGGFSLWSQMEDVDVVHPCGLVLANPPFDRYRQCGRSEAVLMPYMMRWCARGGIFVLIVQTTTLTDSSTDVAKLLTQYCEILQCFKYPMPERGEFGQCLCICKRRAQDGVDAWEDRRKLYSADEWPTLGETADKYELRPVTDRPRVIRTELGAAQVEAALAKSPLRHSLLHTALSPPPRMERPLMALRAGHVGMCLAGGMEVQLNDPEGRPFLVKAMLDVSVREVGKEEKEDENGKVVAVTTTQRTNYSLNLRAIRHNGVIEDYPWFKDEPETVEATA